MIIKIQNLKTVKKSQAYSTTVSFTNRADYQILFAQYFDYIYIYIYVCVCVYNGNMWKVG